MTASESTITLRESLFLLPFVIPNFTMAWSLGASNYLTCDRTNLETVVCTIERRHLLGLWYEKSPRLHLKNVMTTSKTSKSCSEGICEDITTYELVLHDDQNQKNIFHSYLDDDVSQLDLQRLEKFLENPQQTKIVIHRWGMSLVMNIIFLVGFICTLAAPLTMILLLFELFSKLYDFVWRLFNYVR